MYVTLYITLYIILYITLYITFPCIPCTQPYSCDHTTHSTINTTRCSHTPKHQTQPNVCHTIIRTALHSTRLPMPFSWPSTLTARVGQNCIYTPYMTVCMVISLPKTPYKHRIYMVMANPTHRTSGWFLKSVSAACLKPPSWPPLPSSTYCTPASLHLYAAACTHRESVVVTDSDSASIHTLAGDILCARARVVCVSRARKKKKKISWWQHR